MDRFCAPRQRSRIIHRQTDVARKTITFSQSGWCEPCVATIQKINPLPPQPGSIANECMLLIGQVDIPFLQMELGHSQVTVISACRSYQRISNYGSLLNNFAASTNSPLLMRSSTS